MVILAIFFPLPWQHFSAPLCHLIVRKMNKKTKGKMSDGEIEQRRTVSADWPTLSPIYLKAPLDVFEMLHISPILVSAFAAMYSPEKMCYSISSANLSLSSCINTTTAWCETTGLVLKGWCGGAKTISWHKRSCAVGCTSRCNLQILDRLVGSLFPRPVSSNTSYK